MLRWNLFFLALLSSVLACGDSDVEVEEKKTRERAAEMTWTDTPGTEPTDPVRQAELLQALVQLGETYTPRTHHLNEDGSPVYTNELIFQSSPYLLQHAHNPVNWMPWGEEAFALARKLDRPIFLSIGYSTCHWCHVMERESFEDKEIASFINSHFVAIKVDREERPDVDAIYMDAVRAMTGRGGWPLTVVMNAKREPFFGGTYFPARDGDRGQRIGFLSVLQQIQYVWKTDRTKVTEQAQRLSLAVERASSPGLPGEAPGVEVLKKASAQWSSGFDEEWGGFGEGQKFPRPAVLRALLRSHRLDGDERVLHLAVRTLDRMMEGGLRDQLGGGFHRYTVERTWLVPHFEKMLYDNAQLVLAYLEAAQITGRSDYRAVARETLDYVLREMTDSGGGFYSATDADSLNPEGHSEEGWFFTWTPSELEEALGSEQAKNFAAFYGVTTSGNFEGRNILTARRPLETVAKELEVSPDVLRRELDDSKKKLYVLRAKRPPPGLDDKVLAAWNGLMISAFVRGYSTLNEPTYLDSASRAAGFVLSELRREDGRLLRSWRGKSGDAPAVLDDYSFMIAALLDLFEATSEARWADEAIALQKVLDAQFVDVERGGYFLTAADAEELLTRQKPAHDGAIPSGNAIAASNLLRLAEITGQESFREAGERIFSAFSSVLRAQPSTTPQLLVSLDRALSRQLEVVVVCPGKRAEASALLDAIASVFVPGKVVFTTVEGAPQEALASRVPWVAGRPTSRGEATAYVCQQGVCQLPTSDPKTLRAQLLGE